ncbi:FAD-dependent monooxygenase [Laribacter hongkongensis]|uniref:FAD-dependent monooxygenase n=1 Tax=Laribacter hongkongensis TaxID=168471 RepID=UPI001EFE23FE|nr:FAD-dependent monooxygenase [Laribacter hongkongensis]MCG9058473.1 FAD-dependent monooxygenase [Laribacter hongkongensis]MCG9085270.1 FAD-dependent monooxygenase [Laribacter hongkongensis]
MLPAHADVVIVGGGPVGALIALSARSAGRSVLVVEARPREADVHDPRVLALSHASRELLAAQGMWPDSLPATPIDTVHVSQQATFGRTVLNRRDLGLPHMGYTVAYADLYASARAALLAAGVNVAFGARAVSLRTTRCYATLGVSLAGKEQAVTARLVVLADGGSLVSELPDIRYREHDYQQCAVLARLHPELPHHQVAWERFSANGPMAVLPVGDDLMAVWTQSHAGAARLIELDDEAFVAEFAEAFGDRLGRLTACGPRLAVPLKLRMASRIAGRRVALAGNAAQTMHPIAAQGLNLGLRDAAALAALLARPGDPGEVARLDAYVEMRRIDALAVTGFTHSLAYLFDQHDPVRRAVRGAVMTVLDTLPMARRRFAESMVFGVASR